MSPASRLALFFFATCMAMRVEGSAWAQSAAHAPAHPMSEAAVLNNTVVIRLGDRFAVEYERALHPQVSLFVGPALVAGVVNAGGTTVKNELGLGSSLGARFFVRGRAPQGLFIGPILYLGYARVSEQGHTATGLRLSSGAMLGYTTVFFDILAVSLGVGASYLNVTQVADGSEVPGPVETNLRFALGVAF